MARDVARELELTARAVGTLNKCAMLTPQRLGTALIYDEGQLRAFKKRYDEPADDTCPAWIVRLGAPDAGTSDDPRDWTGWSEAWSADQRRQAVSCWWRVAAPDSYKGDALVAMVDRFVVGVWEIRGGRSADGYAAFELGEPTKRQRLAYADRTLKLGRGPVILHLGLSTG